MATTKNNSTIAWEKEFDEKFVLVPNNEDVIIVAPPTAPYVKAFIAQLLHRKDEEAKAQREELLDSLWMEKPIELTDVSRNFPHKASQEKLNGYYQAVQQLQDKITALRSSEEMK